MKFPNCKICGNNVELAFTHIVRDKYLADYFFCKHCGFLCVYDPVWLAEAYDSTITDADTGLLARNITLSRQVSVLIYKLLNPKGCYVDYGGRYGVFTRLMRDAGFDFYHSDPYTNNLFAIGYEWDGTTEMDGVTCFECFEHFTHPLQEISRIFTISKNIIFSTLLMEEYTLPDKSWNYYGFEHGQHIAFYSLKTLRYLACEFKLNFISHGNLHIFTEKKLSAKKFRSVIRKSNRASCLFSNRTNFDRISRQMKK